MKTKYHIQITQKVLVTHFSEKALETIIRANIKQDCPLYQFGHDHFHFDGSAFIESFNYIALQQEIIIENIGLSIPKAARKAFGRLLHTWQDFYSHSNYIELWKNKNGQLRAEQVNHDDPEILEHPNLTSGKNYGLPELIAMIPGIAAFIKPLMPADSHAKMNKDSPQTSLDFNFAYWAAIKRTTAVFDQLQIKMRNNFSRDKIITFTGNQSLEVKV